MNKDDNQNYIAHMRYVRLDADPLEDTLPYTITLTCYERVERGE